MKLEYMLFARYAEVHPEGVLTLCSGAFDGIMFPEGLPFTLPHMAVVIGLQFEPTEAGKEYRLFLEISGPNGKPISPTANFTVTPKPNVFGPSHRLIGLNAVVNVLQMQINAAGEYTFSISVNEQKLHTKSLYVADAGKV